MNELIFAFAIATPFAMAFGLAVLLATFGGMVLKRPSLAALVPLLVVLTVSGSTYGLLSAERSFYSRGAGLLFFSFVSWSVLLCYLWVHVANAFLRRTAPTCNLRPWLGAWVLLVVVHALVGLLVDVELLDSLSPSGLINFVWMSLFLLLLLNAFQDDERAKQLARVLILVGLAKAAFGLVRWAAFGGDPANAYANRHGLSLKLTYFDINDNLVCLLAFLLAALTWLRPQQERLNGFWRLICGATLVAAPLCIVLSFRRTAWIGLVLAMMLVIWFIPRRLRIWTLLAGLPVATAGMAYAAYLRLSQTKGATGLESFFFEFQSRGIGPVSARVLELKLAWTDFLDHPLIGLGSWGRYAGSSMISWQQEATGSFLHSGLLHVGIKSGLVGLVLVAGLYVAFFRFVTQNWRHVREQHLPLMLAGAAGVLFMLPDMIIGTPIPQLRTMLMYGLCFALPYIAVAASRPTGARSTQMRWQGLVRPAYR